MVIIVKVVEFLLHIMVKLLNADWTVVVMYQHVWRLQVLFGMINNRWLYIILLMKTVIHILGE